MQRLAVTLALLLLGGCTSYEFVTTEGPQAERVPQTQPVYVVNKDFENEFDILRRSGLNEFSDDSSVATKLLLYRMDVLPGCGTPLVGTILTLGLLPGVVYDHYVFSYAETGNAGTIERKVQIVLKMRLSAYELFFSGNWKDEVASGRVHSDLRLKAILPAQQCTAQA